MIKMKYYNFFLILFLLASCGAPNKKSFAVTYSHVQKSKVKTGDFIVVLNSNSGNTKIWEALKSDSCIVRIDTMLYEIPFDEINHVAVFGADSIAKSKKGPTEACFGGSVLNTKNDTFYMELKLVYMDSVRGYDFIETRLFFCKEKDIYPGRYIQKNYETDDLNEFFKR